MRVLHFLKSGEYSGAQNVICQIMEAFDNIEDIEMAYCSEGGEIQGVLEKKHFTFYEINGMNKRELLRIIELYHPDIIHAHDFSAGVVASLYAPKSITIINHLHNNPSWIKKINIKTMIYLAASRNFEKILTVSEAVNREYIFGRRIASKVEVIGNPFNAKEICEKAEEEERKENPDIAFIGRLTEQKDPIKFIQIVDEVKKKKEDICAMMIGTGEMEAECQAAIQKLHLEKHIKMVGFKKNPYVYLKNAIILCMPSKWEGFGLVALEAMALGKPVVASDVGGLHEIVTESCGHHADKIEDYAEYILRLLADKNLYKKVSCRARQRAEEYSNIDVYMERLRRIYMK